MEKLEQNGDIIVRAKTLENLFGVGIRTIQRLAEDGIVKRRSKGRYFFKESVTAYITMLKMQIKARAETDDSEEVLDLDAERAKHEQVRREIDEIKLLMIQGKVVNAEDVKACVSDFNAWVKEKTLSLPEHAAAKLEDKQRAEIQTILSQKVEELLDELSQYSPTTYYRDQAE